MGKIWQCLSGALKKRSPPVKIMKDDGNIIKLGTPLYVKDILETHPNHAIFEGEATRPLSPDTELRPGRRYCLISLSIEKVDHGEDRYNTSRDLSKVELPKGSNMRVRVRLSKADLASLLSVDDSKLMKDLIGPLIKQALNNQPLESRDSISPSWKPNLQTIFEEQSPQVYPSAR